MKLFASIITLCVVATTFASPLVEDLDADKFHMVVESHDQVLVLFYAPWCQHCQALEPEYERLAETVNSRPDLDVLLVKVDGTQNEDLAQQFQLEGFPSLMWVTNGKVYEFEEERTYDALLDFCERMVKEGYALDPTWEELNSTLMTSDFTVVGYFAGERDVPNAFKQAVYASKYEAVALLNEMPELEAHLPVSDFPAVVTFRGDARKVIAYPGDLTDSESLQLFIAKERVKKILMWTEDVLDLVWGAEFNSFFFVFADPEADKAQLDTLAEIVEDEKVSAVFIKVVDPEHFLFKFMGVESTPAMRLVELPDLEQEPLVYNYDAPITEEALSDFLAKFEAKELETMQLPDMEEDAYGAEEYDEAAMMEEEGHDEL